jgi:hypothetical protein
MNGVTGNILFPVRQGGMQFENGKVEHHEPRRRLVSA